MADASYSPRLRTALVLTGAGTAGAYQAGVIRGLAEAGVKIDLIAAHGPGIANAVMASVDGGQTAGEAAGPWNAPALAKAYRWRAPLEAAGYGIGLAVVSLLLPFAILVVAALVFAASLLASLVGLTTAAAALVRGYTVALDILFHPPILPTVVPRLMVLCMLGVGAVLVGAWWRARKVRTSRRRRGRGAFWWALVGAPIDASEPAATLHAGVWALVRGASTGQPASRVELGRCYVDLLTDNFGQPGFCDVLLAVHDLDARRDLACAVLGAGARAEFSARRPAGVARDAEAIDLVSPMRDYVADLIAAGVELPGVTEPRAVTFPSDHYWQGETHRLCDRPEIVHRLVEEAIGLGAEQLILVTAAPPGGAPHTLGPTPRDLRGRAGEWQRSVETAVTDDVVAHALTRFSGVFVIRPAHNPIGPFQFGGTYDELSDRTRTLPDLVKQGYDDAQRLFIEPVVASGEKVDTL